MPVQGRAHNYDDSSIHSCGAYGGGAFKGKHSTPSRGTSICVALLEFVCNRSNVACETRIFHVCFHSFTFSVPRSGSYVHNCFLHSNVSAGTRALCSSEINNLIKTSSRASWRTLWKNGCRCFFSRNPLKFVASAKTDASTPAACSASADDNPTRQNSSTSKIIISHLTICSFRALEPSTLSALWKFCFVVKLKGLCVVRESNSFCIKRDF